MQLSVIPAKAGIHRLKTFYNLPELFEKLSFALVQHRLGMEAVKAFNDDVLPLIDVEYIDESIHTAAVSALLVASRKKIRARQKINWHNSRPDLGQICSIEDRTKMA